MQQQQRWQRNTTNQTTYKSSGKTPKISRNYLLQYFSRTSSTRKIRTRSSFSKINVPEGIKTKCSSRRKIFHFVQSGEKLTKYQEILEIVKVYKIPLLRTPIPEKLPLNTPLKENQKFLVEKRDQRNVGEGSNKENLATKRLACSKSIFEQSFSSKEKRWGLPSDYKSENSESVCTLFALQNGKFADFKIYDEGKRLHVQN